MAAAQELENRPSETSIDQPVGEAGLIEHVEVPQASAATQQYVQPVVIPQPQVVRDDKGNTILAPAGEEVVNVPYTPAQIKEDEKTSVESGKHWIAIFWERVIKRALLFGRRVIYGGVN